MAISHHHDTKPAAPLASLTMAELEANLLTATEAVVRERERNNTLHCEIWRCVVGHYMAEIERRAA